MQIVLRLHKHGKPAEVGKSLRKKQSEYHQKVQSNFLLFSKPGQASRDDNDEALKLRR